MKLRQFSLPKDFADFLDDAQRAGNYISVETLFLDSDYFRKEGMEIVATALIAAGADLYSQEDDFIEDETTATEVYLEAYRRCFFDEGYSSRYGCQEVFNDTTARMFIVAHLRFHLDLAEEAAAVDNGPNILPFRKPSSTVH